MKSKLIVGIALVGLIAGSYTQVASADESVSTNATITFTGDNTDPTSPVDPTDPDSPGDGTGTGMSGPLSLDYVPTMDFGTHSISGQVETYESTNLTPYIQTTDKRGSGAGWKVTVSLTSFTNDSSSSSFDGTMTLTNPGVLTTTTNSNTDAPTASSSVTVSPALGDQLLVGTTADNQGMSTWVTNWLPTTTGTTNNSATLTVNTSGVITDAYTATLNWTIHDAP